MSQDLSFTTNRRTVSRPLGGVVALSYPVFLVALAVSTGFRRAGDGELASSYLAALLLLIAEPTAWIFSFDFVDPDRFTIIFVGALTSFPIWYMAGSAIAARTERWRRWVSTYLLICVLWTLLNLVFFVLVAWLFDDPQVADR